MKCPLCPYQPPDGPDLLTHIERAHPLALHDRDKHAATFYADEEALTLTEGEIDHALSPLDEGTP